MPVEFGTVQLEDINLLMESNKDAEYEIGKKLRSIIDRLKPGHEIADADIHSVGEDIVLEVSLLRKFYEGKYSVLEHQIKKLTNEKEKIIAYKRRSNIFAGVSAIVGVPSLIIEVIQFFR